MESFSALLAIYTHSRSHTHWNAHLHSKIKVITNSLHSTYIRRLILVDKQRKIFSTEALDVVWCCRRTDRLVGLSTKSPNMEMVFAIFFFLCASISFWRGDFCLFWSNWVSKAGAQPEKMYAMQRTFQASLEYIYSFAMKNEATERERKNRLFIQLKLFYQKAPPETIFHSVHHFILLLLLVLLRVMLLVAGPTNKRVFIYFGRSSRASGPHRKQKI